MRLLLIDDDPGVRAVIEATAPAWIEVISFGSSREALDVLDHRADSWPELALVDMRLPAHLENLIELEGLAVARWLNRGDGRDVPVVLISAHSFSAEARRRTPGVLGFLGKPLDLGRLYRFLHAWNELFEAPDRTGHRPAPGPANRGVA